VVGETMRYTTELTVLPYSEDNETHIYAYQWKGFGKFSPAWPPPLKGGLLLDDAAIASLKASSNSSGK
jgi:hypothetical protein